jgi:UDP-N-acetylmuramoyl-tripeptide--D-alanyl-D-alanine ligase
MTNLSAGEVESGTGGILLIGSRSAAITGISIDTRTLRPGDLFFAIRGPKHDGHQYIGAALRGGAAGAVVDNLYRPTSEYPPEFILLQVGNTHQALKDVAGDARRHWRGSLVGITGSMGKTTTKEFAAQVLQTEFSVYRSPGNFNNLFGLPLAIFGLSPEDHIGIFEMGMSAPGEIAEMCRIARPDVGVITNVAPVHLEFFASLEAIARAKGELVQGLPASGTLVYNADDSHVREIAAGYAGSLIGFGLSEAADVRATDVEITSLRETRFRIRHDGAAYRAAVPLAGGHFVLNALPAVALGVHYRLPLEQIVESFRHLHSAHMRGQILHFREGFTVIDDSYNSNPRALMQMTTTLCRIPSYTRRILIAGEMLELGRESEALHRECGIWAAECGVDLVVGIQGAAGEIVRGALEAGMIGGRALFFPDVDSAADFISGKVQVGDLALVKGSRGVHLEKLVQLLRTLHPEQAS